MNETCAQCGNELVLDILNVEFAPKADTNNDPEFFKVCSRECAIKLSEVHKQ